MGLHQHFGSLRVADVEGLQNGLDDLASRTLSASGDNYIYGDVLSPFPRFACVGSTSAATGVIYLSQTFSAATLGSFTWITFCVGTTAFGGSGTVRAALYSGPQPSSMTKVVETSATGVTLSAGQVGSLACAQTVVPEDAFIGVALLFTGFSSSGSLRGLNTATSLISPGTGGRLGSSSGTGNSTLPTTINNSSGYSGNGTPHWWALRNAA